MSCLVKTGSAIVLILLLLSPSCIEKEQDALICDVSDPLNDLEWLKDLKKAFEIRMTPLGARIIYYSYKGQDVFWVEDPCCNYEAPHAKVYNCGGRVLLTFDGECNSDCLEFWETATDSLLLFSSAD